MRFKKMTALALAGTMAASLLLGGCGSRINSDAVVVTCGDEELTLGYLNFVARYNQAVYDSMFYYYYGDGYWTDTAYGDGYGGTLEDSVKDAIIEEAELECLMDQHLDDYGVVITDEELDAMKAAGEEFMEENDKKTIREMGATAEYVAQFLYYETVADRMEEAIEAEVGEDLDIADYARRTFSYVKVDGAGYTDDDGEYVEYTDQERSDLLTNMGLFIQLASGTFEETAEDFEYSVSTYSYGEDEASEEDGGFSEAVIQIADGLSEGEISDVIDTGDYLYVIQLDSEDDEDAAESAMESDRSQIKSDHYTEVTDGYKSEFIMHLDTDLWDRVKFEGLFVTDNGEE